MFAVSLLFSVVAWATDSGGNSIYIDQTNADNSTVSITQTGSNNSVGDPSSLLTPQFAIDGNNMNLDRKSTRLNSSHMSESRMPSSA